MKNQSIPLMLTGGLFLLACGLFSQPTAIPTSAASETRVPPTVPSSPTVVPLLFRDDLNEVLAGGWLWQNENPLHWNLTAERGWLEMTVLAGNINDSDYSNLPLRPAPSGNFQLDTRLRFTPVGNFQFAGLIVHRSDADFLQAGRAYCDRSDLCVGDGLYFGSYVSGAFQGFNFATPYEQQAEVYLRLQRRNEFSTFFASPNGTDWTEVGTQRNELQPLHIGPAAGQNNSDPLPARFDYLQVTGLP